jgi:hypothetical protein
MSLQDALLKLILAKIERQEKQRIEAAITKRLATPGTQDLKRVN